MWNDKGNKPILQYLIWVFAIAWICEGFLILGEYTGVVNGTIGFIFSYLIIGFGAGFSPAYATYIVLKKHKKIKGFKSFLSLIFNGTMTKNTIIVTGLFFISQLIVNLITNNYVGNPWYMFIVFLPLMIIGGGIEEIGWRGFLQPAFEDKMPFFLSSILIGIIWTIWHLPLWLVQNSSQSSLNLISFLCYCIVFSFVLGTLYKITKNVFSCILLHAWGNVLGSMFIGNSIHNTPDKLLLTVYLIEIIICVVCFNIFDKRSNSNANL